MDTKDAGVAELEVVCEAMGERRVRLPVDIREDGHTYRVRLRPTVPAHYRIYITYGGMLTLLYNHRNVLNQLGSTDKSFILKKLFTLGIKKTLGTAWNIHKPFHLPSRSSSDRWSI